MRKTHRDGSEGNEMQTNAPSCVCVCVKRICERRTLSGNPALLEGVKSWAATTFACAPIIHPLKGISMRQRRWMAGSFREWHKIGKTQGGSEGADPGWHRGHMEKGRVEASLRLPFENRTHIFSSSEPFLIHLRKTQYT